MKFYYQFLTTPTADTPGTTVLLCFPDKRYLFGQISEGTQRACAERGVKLSYLTDIFLTGRMQWSNNGGLIGVMLSQADALASATAAVEEAAREKEERRKARGIVGQNDAHKPQTKVQHGVPYAVRDGQTVVQRGHLTVHGGKNLTHTVATTRRFIFRQGMPVFTHEYDSENTKRDSAETEDPFQQPTWSDSNIKVWAIPVSPFIRQDSKDVPLRPQSPRKRSHDEFEEPDTAGKSLDRRARDKLIRESVVSDMFNSTWRMDALTETPLAEVRMPATMFVRNPVTKDFERYTGPVPGGKEPLPDIKVYVRQPWPAVLVEKLPPTTWSKEALSYVVRNQDLRGKFDPKKAQELKVKKGPDYQRLTRGESVLSEDGKTVTPDMVLGPPRLGRGIAFVELPAPEYVENLVNRPEWKSPSVMTGLEAFVWILGPGVGDHPKLRNFVASMSHCKHIVSSTDYCPNYLALASVAESSIRLARLKGDSYSVPVHDNVTLPQPGTLTADSDTVKAAVQDSPFEPAEPGLLIDMEPNFGLNRTNVVPRLNPAMTMQRIPRSVETRMSAIRRRINKPEFKRTLEKLEEELPGGDTEIITLGTGSSVPSKYRNVSATLVHVPESGYYLLDCGENTLGQLKRVFEPEKLRQMLQNLRVIWISHLHADHHLGTASLIKAWYDANYGDGALSPSASLSTNSIELDMARILEEKRLFLVSDRMMIEWLQEYASVENYGFEKLVPLSAYNEMGENGVIRSSFVYHHVRGDGTYPGREYEWNKPVMTTLRFQDETSPLTPLLRSATGLSDLLTARVPHCRGSLGVSLVFPNGFKLSYSGDCRPSANLASIGQGSTLLIHEATFQDDMQGSAIAKKHSTTSEALEIGRLMGARTVLLTHFSQRYQKIAQVDQRMGTTKREEDLSCAPDLTVKRHAHPDIPCDNEDEDDVSALHKPSGQGLSLPRRAATNKPRPRAPVAVSFDYMRVRVKDIPVAEAYAPAIEKLFSILELASVQEAEKMKHLRLEEENKKVESKKSKQKNQKNQKKKEAASTAGAVAVAAAIGVGIATDETEPKKAVSVWSASESESGWSDAE